MKVQNLIKLVLLITSLATFNAAAELVVVVNAGSSTSSMTKSELARLFMGKSDAFTAVNQDSSNSIYEQFCSDYLGKNPGQIKAYWSKRMFTGGGTPPQEFGSDAKIVEFVSANVKGVGYIDSASLTDGVKKITVN